MNTAKFINMRITPEMLRNYGKQFELDCGQHADKHKFRPLGQGIVSYNGSRWRAHLEGNVLTLEQSSVEH
jgi:hypothetical protein